MNLQRLLERKLGRGQKRGGDEFGFDCPKCGPASNKFHLGVNVKKELFNCFKCKFKGRLSVLTGIYGKSTIYVVEEKAPSPSLPKDFRLLCQSDKYERAWLEGRGIDFARALSMGLGIGLRGRAVIPIYEAGALMYWIARSTDPISLVKEKSPKKEEISTKRNEVLYGLDEVKHGEVVILVEGIFDAERLRRYGRRAVALLGSKLSDVQCGKVLTKCPQQIIIMFDGDEAGILGARDAMRKIWKRMPRLIVTVVILPQGKDPDELTNAELDKLL